MCQAQQQSASLGYSPMPINLVQASFDQIKKIPGVVVQNVDITQCKNPTFAADGTNLLADTAPQPKACDKSTFASQCPDGTAGLANVQTAVKAVAGGTTGGTTTGGTTKPKPKPKPGTTGSGPTTTLAPGATVAPGDTTPSASTILVVDTTPAQVDSNNGNNGGNNDSGIAVGAVIPTTLGSDSGWNSSLLLVLLVVALTIGVVIVPALVWRYYGSKSS
jgi:phosphate transport system substrate-binding protein